MIQKYNDVMKKATIRIQYKDQKGSGILFEIGGKHIILTAAHVLCNDSYAKKERISIERINGNQLEPISILGCSIVIDNTEDIAALHIETSAEIEVEKLAFGPSIVGDKAILSGYPNALETSEYVKWFPLPGEYREVLQNSAVLTLHDKLDTYSIEGKDYINGYSGGGVFSTNQWQIWLSGIETSVLTSDVGYNSTRCVPIQYIMSFLKNNCSLLQLSSDCIDQINTDVFAIRSNQCYNNHFKLVSDYSTPCSFEKITNQFREGIDAHPEHIRRNLDIVRKKWITRISDSFRKSPIVIICGASGQGKTTLALRYLMDTYGEQYVLIINNISSESLISKVLLSLKTIDNPEKYVLFYDVMPGDTYWAKFVKEAYKIGVRSKILVAIREEDFNMVPLRSHEVQYTDIHIWLTKEEANDIYRVNSSSNYISFENAWSAFGGKGPLLEFTYTLNHSEKMFDRICSQVQSISEEEDAESWFLILGVIAISGKYNEKITTDKLFKKIPCKSRGKLLKRFREELFIKTDESKSCIECLHAVRADLILEALKEEILFDYHKALTVTLSIIDNNTIYMGIDYLISCGVECPFKESFSDVCFFSLKGIASILRTALWFSIYKYLHFNREIINEGNQVLNNQYLLIALTDITGMLTVNESGIDIIENIQPGIRKNIQAIVEKQPNRYLDFTDAKSFISDQAKTISLLVDTCAVDGATLGYILFWAGKLEIAINVNDDLNLLRNGCKSYLDLLKGVNAQNNNTLFNVLKAKYREEIFSFVGIISVREMGNEIFANVVNRIKQDHASEVEMQFNDICMRAIRVLHTFEPDKEKYNVKLIGVQFDNIDIPDTEKKIKKEYLHEKWIVELNRIGLSLENYSLSEDNWVKVSEKIEKYRNNVIELFTNVLSFLDKYFRKGHANIESLKKSLPKWEYSNPFSFPKCALDMYGIRDTVVINNIELKMSEYFIGEESTAVQTSRKKKLGFESSVQAYSDGINNFVRTVPDVIKDLSERRENTHNFRLALFNILSAYEVLPNFQKEYRLFFTDRPTKIDEQHELLVVQKMVAVSEYIFSQGYSQQNSISYNSNELLKKQKRRMDSYIMTELREIINVISVNVDGSTVVIKTPVECYDDVLHNVFDGIKNQIGKTEDLTIKNTYFQQIINTVQVILCKENLEKYRINIPALYFSITDDYEHFKTYLLFSPEKLTSEDDPCTWDEILFSFGIIISQLLQINEGLQECNKDEIVTQSIWQTEKEYRGAINELKKAIIQVSPDNDAVINALEDFENSYLINTVKENNEEWLNKAFNVIYQLKDKSSLE